MAKKSGRGTQHKAEGTQSKVPAHKIELWPVARIHPYARNARRHSAAQIEQLRASFRRFGWTMPLLVREDGTLIAGHGRFEAAKLEGFTEMPVIVATGWSDEQCRAYALADNKLAETSEWDQDLLSLELTELSASGSDLGVIGFSEKELARLMPSSEPSANAPVVIDAAYQILIECKGEGEQLDILARLQRDGINCRALIA